MDVRTSELLRGLDPASMDLLSLLVEKPRSEKGLLESLPEVPQPTAHKKLARLEQIGLIHRQGGRERGLPWSVKAPKETVHFLRALLDLADALVT